MTRGTGRHSMLGLPALLVALSPFAVAAQETTVFLCDDPEGHPWIVETRGRVVQLNELVAFAREQAGEPVSCEGEIMLWQGEEYRTLTLPFDGGLEFTLEVMPPGIQVMHLRANEGFTDPDAAVGALRELTVRMGLSIDWSSAETDVWDGVDVEQFWDPDSGLNASATVGRRDGVIVMLRYSIAS